MKWTHALEYTHSHTHTHKHTQPYVHKHTHKNAPVCVYIRHLLRASMHPHPRHQKHAPAQVMGVPARDHRVPLAQLPPPPVPSACAAAPGLSASAIALPLQSRLRCPPTMSHQTAHPTTPIDSPLVHESHRYRSEAVRFVTHSHV
jgi:hypothetical protein